MTKREPQKIDLGLTGLDELFMTEKERFENQRPKVHNIPLEQLTEFPGHPFQVREDEELDRLTGSIRASGVLTPALVRPKGDGYEVISGHRRLLAARRLGLESLPAVVRDMTDDQAVVTMVDANLQREHILPSEKAFAYKMKLEAISHQGKRADLTSSQVGTKLRSDEKVAEDAGESRNQIQRYIRLTCLLPALLDLVDAGKIAFNPAVELSYLSEKQQRRLLDAMAQNDCTPSHAQAIRLKKAAQAGTLDDAAIDAILAEEKPNQREQIKLKRDVFQPFFPPGYTDAQIAKDILRGLELLKKERERKERRGGAR